MKYYLSISVLFLLTVFGTSQVFSQSTIKFDPANKALIQFDRPFILQVDSVKIGNIQKISVYEVSYKNGISQLVDRQFKRPVRPSFVIDGPPGFTLNGTSLKINIPALRPDRDFDLLIASTFSKDHLKQALQINKDLYLHSRDSDVIVGSNPIIVKEFSTLYNAVNQVPGLSRYPFVVFDFNLLEYRNDIYKPLEPLYSRIINNNEYLSIPGAAKNKIIVKTVWPAAKTVKSKSDKSGGKGNKESPRVTQVVETGKQQVNSVKHLDTIIQSDINALYKYIDHPIFLQYHVGSLQHFVVKDTLNKIFNGITTAVYHLPVINADQFDFDKRISNLTGTIKYIDSLNNCVELIKSKAPNAYKRLDTVFSVWIKYLNDNLNFIKDINNKINKVVLDQSQECMWLAQGTRSGDLKTTSSRHLTLDVGMLDIMAFDNGNQYKNIPKLFFGLNYYFRSIDKTADWSKIPDPGDPNGEVSHYLESKYSVWQRLSVTGGFTLGAMQNKDFDNVYNGLSFTLGPSYRIGNALRVSIGGALLKRYDNEPIRTHSSLILGDYVSLSLDFDLLSAASNITSMLFK